MIAKTNIDPTFVTSAMEIIKSIPRIDVAEDYTIANIAQVLWDELGSCFSDRDANCVAWLIRLDFSSVPNDRTVMGIFTSYFAKALALGQPFGIVEENSSLFQSIEPQPNAHDNSNATTGDFGFHSDNAALMGVFQPEAISLTCVNNEAHAETGIVDAAIIYHALSADFRRASLQHRFSHVVPPSFGSGCAGNSEPRPLFYETPSGIQCALTTYRTEPYRADDELAKLTLIEVERIAKTHANWIDLQPWDILFFRNNRSLHARKPINGRRKLLRAYWRKSLAEFRLFASTDNPFLFSAEKALSIANKL